MSDKKRQTVQAMIDEVRYANGKPQTPKESAETKPAELDQDPGGGYNTNHTNPQA